MTSLRSFILRYRLFAIIPIQILLILLSYTLAFYLRFDLLQIPQQYIATFLKTLPLLLACRLLAYQLYRLNSGWWSFASMYDLINISKAVLLGSILFLLGIVFIYGVAGYPRSIFITEAILNLIFLGGIRFGIRWFKEGYAKPAPKQISYALIVGAGKAGTLLLNEIRINPQMGIRPVGFVDDSPMKKKTYIQDMQVLGNCEDIPRLVKKYTIDEVLIAIPSAGHKKISSIVQMIKKCEVAVKILPSLGELITKNGFISQLRDVPFDKLLDRPVLRFRRKSDLALLRNDIESKVVLVTGAGGSIGSELSRQTAELKPRELILYERNENNLYHLEIELRKSFPNINLLPVLGDILDKEKLNEILGRHKVNLIYHAAAYKHVPMMEREPLEAVRNNILATKAVAELSIANKVQKFVLISTDKAVNPSNILGCTKRICEMVIQGLSGNGTKFIAVRFGNVIGSNGSVIPLFKEQIAAGGPVTVTHSEASRYFMAISEAVQLVMTAGTMGRGGEVLLLDMGSPIKIVDLAHKLIEHSGLTPGKDIEIKFTGLRPGEKLCEELYWKGEGIIPTANEKVTMLSTNGFNKDILFSQIARLEKIKSGKDSKELIKILKSLVTEVTINSHNGASGINSSSLPHTPPPALQEE